MSEWDTPETFATGNHQLAEHKSAAVVELISACGHLGERLVQQNVLAQYDLNWRRWIVLKSIAHFGPTEAQRLTRDLPLAKATTSDVIDSLAKLHLVHRHGTPQDKRRVVLTATQKGTSLVRQVECDIDDFWASRMPVLSCGQEKHLIAMLRAFLRDAMRTVSEP